MDGTEATIARVGTCKKCGASIALGRRGPPAQLCEQCKKEVGSWCVHRVECKQCGRVAWKRIPQDFCSQACSREHERQHAYTHPCKQCGKRFRCAPSDVLNHRAYCSDQCREIAWNQAKVCRCSVCGDKFRPKHKTAGKCCSRECGWELRRRELAPQSRAARVCKLIANIQKAYRKRKKAAAAEAARAEAVAKLRPCMNCGTMFRNGRERLCSLDCRKASRRKNKRSGRKSRVAHGHRERCKIGGLPFDSSVTRDFVFSRDGFVCMLCGMKTVNGDESLAPTIGHIVPLRNPLNTRHGHTPENTCTNCARCNRRQGNAVIIDGHQHHDDPRESLIEKIESTGYPLEWGCVGAENPTSPV